ncbi:c-type cytochrome [Vampirovibrio chlorellavorus]|uniref:c-type cytochrome n=1 Tax=Vampirovibrio chlorellavorus TaxID=758823 RepID=UPI0026ECB148|nr:cytochrome c [Vampirovibrio chlorellavorus]
MNTFILPVLLITIFTLGGCGQLPAASPSATPSSASSAAPQAGSRGQQLFITHCASCHQGMGQTPSPNAVVLNSRTLAAESDFKTLLRKPFSPMMPAFGPEALSDEDVHALYGYLRDTQGKAATE